MRKTAGTVEGLKGVVENKKDNGYSEKEAINYAISLIDGIFSTCKIKVIRSKLYEECYSVESMDKLGAIQAKQKRRDHLIEDL
ncbi:MAG: hypothetical protein ABEJ24_05080 [Candidatus Magasanikbacteria bacterium]